MVGNLGARIIITENPDAFEALPGEVKLINPELSYVKDTPPEFWFLDNVGILKPITDPEKIKEIESHKLTKSLISKQSQVVQESFSRLVEVPEALNMLTELIMEQNNDTRSYFGSMYDKIDEKVMVYFKLSRDIEQKYFISLVFLNIILIVLTWFLVFYKQ